MAVGEQRDPGHAQRLHLIAGFLPAPGANGHRRGIDGEGVVATLAGREVVTAAALGSDLALVRLFPSYNGDQAFEPFQFRRRDLVNELESLLDTRTRPASGQSSIIPDLTYRFAWKAGVYSSATEYSPEQHAVNHHTLLFKHAKKFSVIGPSEIAFVHFPWSGEKLLPLDNGSKRFFSRFGEEFFYGYNASQVPAAKFNTSFKTPILTGEVAANLSIVLFLEEFTATANDPNTINVSASYLLNTTAKHSLVGSPFEQYLIAQGAFKL